MGDRLGGRLTLSVLSASVLEELLDVGDLLGLLGGSMKDVS